VRANIPCVTTVQGLGAAVQGIEALKRGDIGVRSLQDWATWGAPPPVDPPQDEEVAALPAPSVPPIGTRSARGSAGSAAVERRD
jgi:hypothetical protein